jgi:uncharacterized membrane protein
MNFIKTTLLGGFLVLFPLLLLYLGLSEIAGLLVAMAEPIAGIFPPDSFKGVNLPVIVAIALITFVSFVLGLLMRSKWMRSIGSEIERALLYKLPMYKMLKTISAAFTSTDSSAFRPALVKADGGGGDPCYVVEQHSNGLATILLPWSPTSFAGTIKVVHSDQLQNLDCTLDTFSLSLSHMGVGVESCLNSGQQTVPAK